MTGVPPKTFFNPRVQAHRGALARQEAALPSAPDAKGATVAQSSPAIRSARKTSAATDSQTPPARPLSARHRQALKPSQVSSQDVHSRDLAGPGGLGLQDEATSDPDPARGERAGMLEPGMARLAFSPLGAQTWRGILEPLASREPPDVALALALIDSVFAQPSPAVAHEASAIGLIELAALCCSPPGRLGPPAFVDHLFDAARQGWPANRLQWAADTLAAWALPWRDLIGAGILRHLPELSASQINRLGHYLPEDPRAVLALASDTARPAQFGAIVLALADGQARRARGEGLDHDLRARAQDAKAAPAKLSDMQARLHQAALDAVLSRDTAARPSPKRREAAWQLLVSAAGRNSPAAIDEAATGLRELGLNASSRDKLRYLLLAMSDRRLLPLRHRRDQVMARLAALPASEPADRARAQAAGQLRELYQAYARQCLADEADLQAQLRFIEEETAWLRGLVDRTGNLREPKQAVREALRAFRFLVEARAVRARA